MEACGVRLSFEKKLRPVPRTYQRNKTTGLDAYGISLVPLNRTIVYCNQMRAARRGGLKLETDYTAKVIVIHFNLDW